ncbi:hypothetical protein NBG4_720005 [Candidatus Sulfobium mesophilum]|uniref:Uncharacterized protein n=1 Tax=Candidatus Sulfobium mesophilum TaxID=2016548 RepID=A0A2U3QKA1_9BACT|nr:hypothetical protein NBG4_720005 [Candidatus Sulfobium mesophilum]
MEEERKQGTIASILLFFLGMIAQAAGAADIQINSEFLTSPYAKLTGTVSGAAEVELNGDVNVTGGLAAVYFIGSGAWLTVIPGADLYSNVVTVDSSGGDYTNPAAAMTNYSKWCPSPSAASPCLLKILPGVFDVGTGSVVMQPYIDIEGSGEDTTVITGSIDGGGTSCGPPPANGVVNGANKAEIRRLTVRHTGGGTGAAAIANSDASPKVTNVTVKVSPSSLCSVGIRNRNFSPIIAGARVTATGSGL